MNWRAANSITTLRKQLNALFPERSKASDGLIGDQAHSKRKSDHNPTPAGIVCAFDVTHDPKNGVDCHKLAKALQDSGDKRIKYLIWTGRITRIDNVRQWKTYTGANPHNHHLHLSVSSNPKLYDDAAQWNLSIFKKQLAPVLPAQSANRSEKVLFNPSTDSPDARIEAADNNFSYPPQPIPVSDNAAASAPAVETTTTATVERGGQTATSEITAKNEQNVNDTIEVVAPAKYNKIGFWQTIKMDLLGIFGANATIQTVAEQGTQMQGYVPPSLLTKLAYLVALISIAYLLFRTVHYIVDRYQKRQQTELKALIDSDISRKNMVWVEAPEDVKNAEIQGIQR